MTLDTLNKSDEVPGEIVHDLMKIIPSWRDVDLTKKGYNDQYINTLIEVAIYVLEREKKAIEALK